MATPLRLPWYAIALLALSLASPSLAGSIHVPSDQPTIQAGIDAAAAGDTVLVAPGTYTGPSNRDLDFAGKNLVLRSSGGPEATIIDCQTQGRGFVFQNGETAASVVEGFTIQNGLANGTFGGAILIEGGAMPTIRECRFVSNHANTGGAVYVEGSGAALTGCDLEGNTADNFGGGVYGQGAGLELSGCSFAENGAAFGAGLYVNFASAVELSDCEFSHNVPQNLGGGVYGSGSTMVLRRCTFAGHTANVGAGVYLEEGTASVDSCTFSMNTADYGGGGMYAGSVEALTVTGCRFEGNVAQSIEATLPIGGGGLRATGGPSIDAHIADCTFIGNRAAGPNPNYGYGGGLYGGGSESVIERCTFLDNYAIKVGGGHYGSGSRRQCVFQGNTTGGSGGGSNGSGELIDCRFIDNHAGNLGGGANGAGTAVRCEFSGNSAANRGGGFARSAFPSYTIEDCRFSDNYAPEGGGMFLYSVDPSSVTGCTFERNTGFHQGGAAVIRGPADEPAPVTFSGCTLVGNGSPLGAGGLNLWIPVEIENTIIAFGTEGEAISCTDIGVGVVSCTDIFGNAAGDWTGCVADQLGIQGNFSANPLFCNVGTGDYTLAEASP
jgi:hypothetical protein